MASIIPRRNRFCVVYAYTDASGKKHQKWETYEAMAALLNAYRNHHQ